MHPDNKSKPILIYGPTASGKTARSLEIARELSPGGKPGAEIISADSMLVYRGMDIGTAKPSPEERKEIPHHLVDIRNPDQDWTVADFIAQAETLVPEIQNRNRTPIIVGGTGLYFWCLTQGFQFPMAEADPELRAILEEQAKHDALALHAELEKVDPAAAKRIHANDQKRLVRALEVFKLTGRPISEAQKERRPVLKEYQLIKMDLPREELYERINRRVDQMIERGLIEEVKALLLRGYTREMKSMQALGYKETIDFLSGIWGNPEDPAVKTIYIEELKKRTRNFGRRQMNWLKRLHA